MVYAQEAGSHKGMTVDAVLSESSEVAVADAMQGCVVLVVKGLRKCGRCATR